MSWQAGYEESVRQLRALTALATDRAGAMRSANDRLGGVRIESWSPQRDVKVVIDSTGLIQDVEFTEAATRSSPLALNLSLMRAHDDALRRLAAQVEEIAADELGDSPELREQLQGTYRNGLPARIFDAPPE
ncbi:hypothetical protein EXU48_10355 [Occultella glacieicola]|uniref:YbaB/EbfC DNA-binding family protein n=1 Tax=Occultella glacieicola TaxID=2518684 RepID=A0ABY2E379_9MICO|nr:hypothetical protein [Occultella glacieicola]TDE93872.1 hypothetical protein EXU48_10355 [Occultella glacieicola]